VRNFAQWKSDTGGDSHSSTIDLIQMKAIFANYAGNDFKLAAGSAAIDKGTSGLTNGNLKSAATADLLRSARPAGKGFDIGAYEAPKPFAAVSGHTLTIAGTSAADSISISKTTSKFAITRNGDTEKVSGGSITSIQIFGDEGEDRIIVGAGVFGCYIDAGVGNDFIQGGDGNDTITGGAGKDKAYGGAGDDRLNGNGGHDKLFGESGKDRLYGGDGNDTLDGGSSTDRMWGDAGANFYYGQGGDDYLYARNGQADALFGGTGTDHSQLDPGIDTTDGIENLLP
jgi:Ca2+-binding RTX toxin-like protein